VRPIARFPRLFVAEAMPTPEEIERGKTPPPMTPEEHQKMSEEAWARAEECGPAFKGPFLRPWIEHSHHKYSRSWHPAICGGGPAAVVQGSGMRFKWFAFNLLFGNAFGECDVPQGQYLTAEQAMAAADEFLAKDIGEHASWVNYPLSVTLHIEASPWTLARAVDDQWIRTWKDWPDEKALAARIVQRGEEFHFTCWGIYSEGHIGWGKANDLKRAKELADTTLREYCQASDVVRGT